MPARVVVDNLKAAITQAVWDDPQVQYAYRECAEHYGFRIAPCRPTTPEHKGKVENGVACCFFMRPSTGKSRPGCAGHANDLAHKR